MGTRGVGSAGSARVPNWLKPVIIAGGMALPVVPGAIYNLVRPRTASSADVAESKKREPRPLDFLIAPMALLYGISFIPGINSRLAARILQSRGIRVSAPDKTVDAEIKDLTAQLEAKKDAESTEVIIRRVFANWAVAAKDNHDRTSLGTAAMVIGAVAGGALQPLFFAPGISQGHSFGRLSLGFALGFVGLAAFAATSKNASGLTKTITYVLAALFVGAGSMLFNQELFGR